VNNPPSVDLLSKPPQKPHNPPKRKEVRALTIAAGFACDWGYVLCADRQMSHGTSGEIGSFASYEEKVFQTWDDDPNQAALCGAGNDGYLLHPFSEALFANLAKPQGETTQSIFESTLNAFAEKLNRPPDMQTLLADSTLGPGLLKSDGLIVSPARPIEILGIGETSLVRYLTDTLHSRTMDLHHGVAMAAFVVCAAKKYCPQYCGGQTDIVAISIWDGTSIRFDENQIQTLEDTFMKEGEKSLFHLLDVAAATLK